MKRFEILVKNKINGQLSDKEAGELQQLVKEDEYCRLIYETFFSKPTVKKFSISEVEQAYAVHYRKIKEVE